MSLKQVRQEKISELIRSRAAGTQRELVQRLKGLGIEATQSTLSRDLADLGVYKADGVYHLPRLDRGESSLVDLLDLDTAGDHLVVLKTSPGQASVLALMIDRAGIPEVVGTLAGDDAILVAVKGAAEQKRAIRAIWALFRK